MATPEEVRRSEELMEMLADACCETSETQIGQPLYSVGYRNKTGQGGCSWPATGDREKAEQELARRKTEETGGRWGIAYWYIEERRVFAKTIIVCAEAP